MSDRLDAYTRYLRDNIPLSGAMEVRVTHYDGHRAILQAPFAPNINHRHTIFGGSLATLGILAGWFVLHERMVDEKTVARLVIQKSEVDYLLPGSSAFEAECCLDAASFRQFFKVLQRKGKSRMELCSVISSEQQIIARHQGLYVALGR